MEDEREVRRLWRSAALPGLRVMLLDRVTRDWRGATEAVAIALQQRGHSEVTVRGRTILATPGTVTICAPAEAYVVRRRGPSRSLVFHIEPRLLERFGVAPPNAPLSHERSPALRHELRSLHRAVAANQSARIQRAAIARVASALEGRAPGEWERAIDPVSEAVAAARAAIRRHLGEPLSIAELAESARVSPIALARAFKHEVGVPPHFFLTSLRVARALSLLESGHSIADTATQVGFADQSHLNRYFRRILGTTPARFLRAVSAVQSNE